MNTTVQLTSLLLGLLVAAIAIMLIVRKYSETQYRLLQLDALRRVVSQYRLSKMLAYIGIKLDDYVTRIPTEEIRSHVKHCKSCPDVHICDRCLRDGQYVSDMHFCPNYDSLMSYSRVMPSVE